jgi:hypothetical protein
MMAFVALSMDYNLTYSKGDCAGMNMMMIFIRPFFTLKATPSAATITVAARD